MTTDRVGGILLIAGSVVFLVGAAIAVPGVFTESDPQARLSMLTEHLTLWRIGQPLYGLGALITAIGVAYLAATAGLTNPTVIIVVDRTDLDTQITATFNASDVPNMVSSNSRRELQTFLSANPYIN